jgi:hypothetical protein
MEWLAAHGAHLYLPVGHSPDIDLIAELHGRLLRIEVKTSTCRRGSRWNVLIATKGGNQSWNGVVKYFDPRRCDYLFVHVGDGRRWFIPTRVIESRSGMNLGGAKYSEFEIEPGRPLIEDSPPLESSTAPGEYPSGQRGGAVNAMAQPSQVRILPPPSEGSGTELPESGSHRLPHLDVGHTVIWTKRRMTIPRAPFTAAELEVGDTLRIRANGIGRLVFERIDRS